MKRLVACLAMASWMVACGAPTEFSAMAGDEDGRQDDKVHYAGIVLYPKASGGCSAKIVPYKIKLKRKTTLGGGKERILWGVVDACNDYSGSTPTPHKVCLKIANDPTVNDGKNCAELPSNRPRKNRDFIRLKIKNKTTESGTINYSYAVYLDDPDNVVDDPDIEIDW
jgi:hypothetical protein